MNNEQPQEHLHQAAVEPFTQNDLSSTRDEKSLVQLFIGKNAERFIPYYHEPKRTSWNWVAFFFATIWLMYRKMYVHAFIVFLLPFALVLVFPDLASGSFVGIGVAFAMLGNRMYVDHAKAKVRKVEQKYGHLPVSERDEIIRKMGDVSVGGAILATLINVAAAVIAIVPLLSK